MEGEHHVYTEKIHHLKCASCREAINTNDVSHEINKADAIRLFQSEGWVYLRGKGWLCAKCKALKKT